ncbi:hypothetical protein PHLGIDRAFT_96217 [Phlebiopsis gigantea 11061_1 CR5-6]|uniref:BTB domain-containing protein n=1 Tax=Phlebiopsis gigantea (strain 11061_1 CR5-6) TaxID=745531 RepID=A0A0C3NCH8_PHLG1|nr:hypothetical protein PHLGIDRAFT_96217 [Phlebiopsis gigantea 11061_1 CR5-6]
MSLAQSNNKSLHLPELNSAYADIVLRSSDNTEYRMAKSMLSQASPFFEQMFTLPQPETAGEPQDDLPVIPLSEPGEVLDVLLRFCVPQPPPKLDDLTVALRILNASKKYDMEWARAVANDAFARCAEKEPLRAYCLACKHDLADGVRSAARHCLRLSLEHIIDSPPSDVEDISGAELLRLLQYRRSCRDAVATRVLSWAWLSEYYASLGVVPRNKVWAFDCCTQAGSRNDDQGITITSRQWWLDYMLQTVDKLRVSTWEGTVRGEDALAAFIQSGSCARCCAAATSDLVHFTQHMAKEVAAVISETTQKFWP